MIDMSRRSLSVDLSNLLASTRTTEAEDHMQPSDGEERKFEGLDPEWPG